MGWVMGWVMDWGQLALGLPQVLEVGWQQLLLLLGWAQLLVTGWELLLPG
jgi:hypothetical protein